MPGIHAFLSPSGASRWLKCTKSARLEATFPDTSSPEATEGTLAHALGELMIGHKAGIVKDAAFKKKLAIIESDEMYNEDMYGYMDDYSDWVIELYNFTLSHSVDAELLLEIKLDLSEFIPESFGTGDVCILADGTLNIIDLKYGKGVQVDAHDNSQMKLYALGALALFGDLYAIDTVEMTIYQPRMYNVSTFTMPAKELRAWGETYLIPRAQLAFEGGGTFEPGENCRFCKARAVCRANAEYQMELAAYEFRKAETLSNTEIAEILAKSGGFSAWINAVESWALSQAIQGENFPGYKLVEGRSTRQITDPEGVAKTLQLQGFIEKDIYNKKLVGLGALEKLVGKKDFETLLSPYIDKPPGKPTLVVEADKRQPLDREGQAANDFKNV